MKRAIKLVEVEYQPFEPKETGSYELGELQVIELPKMSQKKIQSKLDDMHGKVLIVGIIEKVMKREMDLETFIKYSKVVEE